MPNKTINNLKLGIFVLAGLAFLILMLYLIGKNRSLFGSNFILKARFTNVQGLKAGNNVRFSGIDVGTVKKVAIIEDTLIEVTMNLDNTMRNVIRKNAVVSIGTDGFVGNKVVNIVPGKTVSEPAAEQEILQSKRPLDTDEMLRTLSRTNEDIAVIASELKLTMHRLNTSSPMWEILNDKEVPVSIRRSAMNVQAATARANKLVSDLETLITDVQEGKGSVGILLKDTVFANRLNLAAGKIASAAAQSDSLTGMIRKDLDAINAEIVSGKGTLNLLLKDSVSANQLRSTLNNIQQGTDGFNQNMEALKHNFLFRGYFRKKKK